MSSFEINTEISIDIFVVHPRGVSSESGLNSTFDDLPPFIGRGLLLKAESSPSVWIFDGTVNPNRIQIPSGISVGAEDRIASSHRIEVGNKIGRNVDPCLRNSPSIQESLPNLTTGIVDTAAISFSLVNPRWQRFLSSDFMSTHGQVVIYRVIEEIRTPVWWGVITRVGMKDLETSISARPFIKRLDQKATFGFEGEIIKWAPDFNIPIISARLIPYGFEVHSVPPQYASSYPEWRQDLSNITAPVFERDEDEAANKEARLKELTKQYNDALKEEKPLQAAYDSAQEARKAAESTVATECNIEG